jgi:outer membrane protein OmpA-like peptidoglycan-associated protein
MTSKTLLRIAFFISMPFAILAQQAPALKPQVIKLDNPSFEGLPSSGIAPQGWFDCGFAGESPVDVQPNGGFQVTKNAAHGSTYLGMVTRDNNTWEAVGQRLKSPLIKGTVYTFSVSACRSESYLSQSRITAKEVNYTQPIILRIWAGAGYCSKEDMLAETELVSNTTWQKYNFKFTPKSNYAYLTIECFYKVPTLFPYNGNLLLDNLSDIVPEIKKEQPPIAKVDPPKPKQPTTTPEKPKTEPAKPKDTPSVASVETAKKPEPKKKVEEPKEEIQTISPQQIREGQIIKVEKLQFEATKAVITEGSAPALEEIFQFLAGNPNLIVEIGGHTNLVMTDDFSAERLSKMRAQAVADELVKRGIDKKRLAIKGYGKSKPIEKEINPTANKINQRVEIKILSTNG